jgi:tRNA A-37 threonylcarbamoyl transferase component Bud32
VEDPLAAFDPTADEDLSSIADRYIIKAKIGQGGMGRVFRAHDKILDRDVAVKLLNRELLDDHFVRRFQQEARAASQLKHPNILCVLDFGLLNSRQPYMVMEWVDGESLEDRIQREGTMNVAEALHIMLQIAEGMNHAHRVGIIHRDLKPANIMMSKTDTGEKALILDFGIAKIENDRADGMLTITGQIIGSPSCMSPEQARGEQLDRRADIYALGCVLFTMLTGKPPFVGDTAMSTINMHLSEPVPSLSDRTPAFIPEGLENIVCKMLAKDVDERYSAMSELGPAIEELDFEPLQATLAAQPLEGQTPAGSTTGGTRIKIAAGIVMVIAAGAAAAIFFLALFPSAQDKISDSLPQEKYVKHKTLEDANIFAMADEKDVTNQVEGQFSAARNLKKGDYFTVGEHSSADEIQQLLKEHKNAFHINFYGTKITKDVVNLLTNTPRVRGLRFHAVRIEPDQLVRVFSIKHLKALKTVRNPPSLEALKQLKNNPKLTDLQIYSGRIKDDELREIVKCKNLEILELKDNGPFSLNAKQALATLPRLACLNLESCKLTDEDLGWISKIKSLTVLALKTNGPFTAPALKQLSNLKLIDELRLEDTGLDTAGMLSISKIPRLKRLDVSSNKNVTAGSLQHFVGRKDLTVAVANTSIDLSKLTDLSRQLDGLNLTEVRRASKFSASANLMPLDPGK